MPKFKDHVDNTWTVKMKKPKKVKELNPETLRNKTYRRTNHLVTSIPPEKRSFKNIPKYADGREKVDFKDWLEIDAEKTKDSHAVATFGKSKADGKYYGWSHRAVGGFGIGDTVKKDGEEYTIKTDDEAKQAAMDFADEVS
jgi:hypothetical protein